MLSGLATDQLTRVNAVSADVDRTPAVARQVWERARLLAEMCRLETGLDENAKQLDAAATSLQEQLRTSIAAAVARQENRAVAAKDLKTARAAWIQAGTLLRYYPVETDQTSVAAYQALVLAHEGARQEIQRKFSSSPPSQP